jgi:hypothetical protein
MVVEGGGRGEGEGGGGEEGSVFNQKMILPVFNPNTCQIILKTNPGSSRIIHGLSWIILDHPFYNNPEGSSVKRILPGLSQDYPWIILEYPILLRNGESVEALKRTIQDSPGGSFTNF